MRSLQPSRLSWFVICSGVFVRLAYIAAVADGSRARIATPKWGSKRRFARVSQRIAGHSYTVASAASTIRYLSSLLSPPRAELSTKLRFLHVQGHRGGFLSFAARRVAYLYIRPPFYHTRRRLPVQDLGQQENCKVRGLVRFSAERHATAAGRLAENVDLSPSRSTLLFSCRQRGAG
jgi:hypothetical protein